MGQAEQPLDSARRHDNKNDAKEGDDKPEIALESDEKDVWSVS